jgi:hypothetical protein
MSYGVGSYSQPEKRAASPDQFDRIWRPPGSAGNYRQEWRVAWGKPPKRPRKIVVIRRKNPLS